jgi:hypothetical protein
VFQIGDLTKNNSNDFNFEIFVKILNNSFKFVPCLHINDYIIFRNMLLYFENNLLDLNKRFFFLERNFIRDSLRLDKNSQVNNFNLTTNCNSIDCFF